MTEDSGDAATTEKPFKVQLDEDDFGYDVFPNRGGKKSWWQKMPTLPTTFGVGISKNTIRCYKSVVECYRSSQLVKILIHALESKGCPVLLGRHVSCEDCGVGIHGGFDAVHKQVVVCQNNTKRQASVCGALAHELTHMFDYCRAHVDFTNLEHLACTEIRAANFFHCNWVNAHGDGDVSILNYKRSHKDCVYNKAMISVLSARNVDYETAAEAIDKVFTRCYNDLEPYGRFLVPRTGNITGAEHDLKLFYPARKTPPQRGGDTLEDTGVERAGDAERFGSDTALGDTVRAENADFEALGNATDSMGKAEPSARGSKCVSPASAGATYLEPRALGTNSTGKTEPLGMDELVGSQSRTEAGDTSAPIGGNDTEAKFSS